VELAGFEIRDQLMWLYASGFPKAQDIGKAIDKRGKRIDIGITTDQAKTILATLFEQSNKSNTQINKECGFVASSYLKKREDSNDGWGDIVPIDSKWQKLKEVLGCDDSYDHIFCSAQREVIGSKESGCFDNEHQGYTIGARSKSVEVSIANTDTAKQWEGYKTALKPAHEPIVMARKPYKGSTIDNVLKNGLGAMNIDATRIPWADAADAESQINCYGHPNVQGRKGAAGLTDIGISSTPDSRESFSQRKAGECKKKKSDRQHRIDAAIRGNKSEAVTGALKGEFGFGPIQPSKEMIEELNGGRYPSNVIGEVAEGYQKYFYCPKVGRSERHSGFQDQKPLKEIAEKLGCEMKGTLWYCPNGNSVSQEGLRTELEKMYGPEWETLDKPLSNKDMVIAMGGHFLEDGAAGSYWAPHIGVTMEHGITKVYAEWCKANNKQTGNTGNNHPTVKPVALMDYLIKLVTPPSTPELQRKVLDPFMGSGSTGMAAVALGHHFTGCELDAKYIAIAETRINAWTGGSSEVEETESTPREQTVFERLFGV
jgi:hypothetical protein